MSAPVDVLAVRAKAESAMWALFDAADNIADANTRGTVSSLIYSAIQNANDTVDDERSEPASEWGSVARRSLESLIDCGGPEVTADVRAWFIAESRKAVLS